MLKRKFYDHYPLLALVIFFACFSNIRATHMIDIYVNISLIHMHSYACMCDVCVCEVGLND